MSWDYAEHEYHLAVLLLICAMLGMGAKLTLDDFRRVVRVPQGVLLVFAMQLVVTPWLAIGLAHFMAVPEGIAVGMLLLAAIPGGLFSNMFTYFARGNVALSISATAACTLGCLITTALVLKVYGARRIPADFEMPLGRILFEITFCLLLPLALGMAVRRYRSGLSPLLGVFCIRASLVILAVIVIGSVTSGRLQVTAYGWRTPLALIAFGVISYYACFPLGFLFRMRMNDMVTIAIEVLVRNAHLGILLKASLFPAVAGVADPIAEGVLFVILFYGGVSLAIGGVAVAVRRLELHLYEKRTAVEAEPEEGTGG